MDWEEEGWEDDYESYTRNEMDNIISGLYDDIMAEVKEVYHSPKQNKNFFFKVHPKRVAYKSIVKQKLFEYLTSGGYIEDNGFEKFKVIFSGQEIDKDFNLITWKKQFNLCPYLFLELADREIISDFRLPKKIKLVFGIKGVSQKINRYKDSDLGIPKNSKPINAIVDNILKCLV
jgi:hypothetical protein